MSKESQYQNTTPERTGEVVLETNQSAIATPAKQMVKSRRSSLKDHSLPSESKEVTLEKEQALQEASKQLVKTRKSSLTGQSLPFESSAVTLEKEGRVSQVKETKGLVIAADMTAQQLQETSFMKSLEKSTKDETMAAQVPHGHSLLQSICSHDFNFDSSRWRRSDQIKPSETVTAQMTKVIIPGMILEHQSTVQLEKEDEMKHDIPTSFAATAHHITLQNHPNYGVNQHSRKRV